MTPAEHAATDGDGLSKARIADLTATYRDGLLADTLPFWQRHAVDHEHGGFITSLDRDGRLSSRLKGNLWKGPFHLPRMQLVCWEELVAT